MHKAALFLRSLVYLLVMVVATLIWSFVCFAVAPLPYTRRYAVTKQWNLFVIWCGKVICGMDYEIRGWDNLKDTPTILLSKHQSAWETIFLLCKMPHPLVFVFKKELLYVPFFGWALGLLRMIPIDRNRGRDAFKQVVAHGKRRLADGQWIIMFPEGTRIPVGKAGKYKSGGARLALETGATVVPIAHNSGDCWPRNSFIKRPGKIIVSIGPSIPTEGLDPDQLMSRVEQWIEAEMRVITPGAYRA
ncbi:MAG TPA: lysophospholipid acyltransferase family protein [Burkholderiaceae bacterium]